MATLRGYGVLQGGDRNNSLSDAQIKAVDFVVLRDRWSKLEGVKQQYNFDYLIAQMKRCMKLKKPFTVSVMTGEDCNPSYLVKKQPWNLANLERYRLLHLELRKEMESEDIDFDLIAEVWITGPTVPSQEMHTKGAEKWSGYSAKKMEDAWKRAIQIIAEVWGDVATHFDLSISGQNPVYRYYLDNVIKYAVEAFGSKSVAFQHNSLGTQTSLHANHHKKLLQLWAQGYRVGAEMVQPGHTAAVKKFPEASFIVLYPQDLEKIKSLPARPKN